MEWDGEGEIDVTDQETFLLCFDFTRERFGPRLPMPFHSHAEETVALSSVREEQLAVLYQGDSSCLVEIWVTNRIEPNAVSWRKVFLSVDIEPFFGLHQIDFSGGSFIIDEEQKLALIFDKDKEYIHNTAYPIGENGYYKTLDLGEDRYHREKTGEYTSMPLVCSYFPTLVKIQQRARRGKRKERDY